MLIFLLLFPLFIGGSVFILPDLKSRNRMLVFAALLHSACVFSCWEFKPAVTMNGFLGLDPLGLLVLSVISILFLMVSFYLTGYFKNESALSHRVFICFLLLFLSLPVPIYCLVWFYDTLRCIYPICFPLNPSRFC